MFDSLLIANRGEIACRIIRTAHQMGIRTIAVFSDADRNAPHVKLADEAVHIGPAPAAESYLNSQRLLAAAQQTGADALHPGYGFLSERADFARACVEAGVAWVGPRADLIAQMGDKIAAKELAVLAGVPCLPGYAGTEQEDATLRAAAVEIGLPVMIKASAGGGGKGMRAVHRQEDLAEAITAARAEARRAFGDGRLLIEKLIQAPRHIEVQLLGDQHGNLLHLYERDCSVQRHHQKLVEEAPAPRFSGEARAALHQAALRLGQSIGYDNVGTVEFILDGGTNEFFFLEMNTRLQVEHTVTEEITGLDLVELQLKAAFGHPLNLTQAQIPCRGHAIEVRLTAEDPSEGFRPSTGRVSRWASPPGLRVDSGIAEGLEISPHYDSMVAKCIAWAETRDAARCKLANGLGQLRISGVKTNRLLLRDSLLHPDFACGGVTTGFLAKAWPDGWAAKPGADLFPLAALARHLAQPLARAGVETPWQSLGGFRLLTAAGHSARTTYRDRGLQGCEVQIMSLPDGYLLKSSEAQLEVLASLDPAGNLSVTREGHRQVFGVVFQGDQTALYGPDGEAVFHPLAVGDLSAEAGRAVAGTGGILSATMPGVVAEVRVAPGTLVVPGDVLVTLESMKLMMDLKADLTATVKEVCVSAGQAVSAGDALIRLEVAENDR